MNKFLVLPLICSVGFFAAQDYNGSTLAPVILAGSVIKVSHQETNKKYPRKNCPVCKGKGWYISGDGIKKVDCGYCEPESATSIILKQ
jgi:hypothetical protein